MPRNSLADIFSFSSFYVTNDLHNTKIKDKLTKHKTEPNLIFGDHIGETEEVKQKRKNKQIHPYIFIRKYYLQSFLAEIKHLVKKYLTSYVC